MQKKNALVRLTEAGIKIINGRFNNNGFFQHTGTFEQMYSIVIPVVHRWALKL